MQRPLKSDHIDGFDLLIFIGLILSLNDLVCWPITEFAAISWLISKFKTAFLDSAAVGLSECGCLGYIRVL